MSDYLLIDEEINRVKIPRYENRQMPFEMRLAEGVAKAQIQKIYKWGLENCPHTKGITQYYKHACDDCWETLRE